MGNEVQGSGDVAFLAVQVDHTDVGELRPFGLELPPPRAGDDREPLGGVEMVLKVDAKRAVARAVHVVSSTPEDVPVRGVGGELRRIDAVGGAVDAVKKVMR